MSFIEYRIDDKVAFGFTVDPNYKTQIVPMDNGKEARNADWTKAKRLLSAQYYKFTKAEFDTLLAAYHACYGSAYAFRFKDHTDYEVIGGALGVTPGANTTPIQLVKKYTLGPQTNTRVIRKPVSGTVTVYQDTGSGPIAKPGTIDTTTGLFTPSTAWTAAAVLTGDFEFDLAVRFNGDRMPSAVESVNKIVTDAEFIEDFS